jgi:acetolactate decarboxylase
MPKLSCEISESLMEALLARRAQTGETLSHIVMSSLADTLEIEHSTLFQISTAGALVKGLYDGVVSIGELKQHGNFGLGTFDALDGEMLAIDGHFYHVQASGAVNEAEDSATVPFAIVTRFRAEHTFELGRAECVDDLAAQLDAKRRTDNLFCAVRIEGRFPYVKTRAACKATSGQSLLVATAHQAQFKFEDTAGTMVGFWCPPYARSINVTGWHLHFLTKDLTGGGHALDCRAENLRGEMQEFADVRLAIPETAAFLQADLSKDPSRELDVAERGGLRHDASRN